MRMEKAIQVLEARKKKEEQAEAQKVQEKIAELQTTIVKTQEKKDKERETNRRTMKLELSNLREAMVPFFFFFFFPSIPEAFHLLSVGPNAKRAKSFIGFCSE